MLNFIYISIVLIAARAIILGTAIIVARKVFQLVSRSYRQSWRNLYLLMFFFFAAYVAAIFIVSKGQLDILVLLMALVFLERAHFV
ncbi:MAG: ABC-type amino acid transport system permease subunit [Candidatus Azotimanducaceae bacterium]